jgi:hypothetical protein
MRKEKLRDSGIIHVPFLPTPRKKLLLYPSVIRTTEILGGWGEERVMVYDLGEEAASRSATTGGLVHPPGCVQCHGFKTQLKYVLSCCTFPLKWSPLEGPSLTALFLVAGGEACFSRFRNCDLV